MFVVLSMALALVACGSRRHVMPNTGIRLGADRLVVSRAADRDVVSAAPTDAGAEARAAMHLGAAATPAAIPAAIGAGFSDKLLAQAAKIAARIADRKLASLQGDLEADVSLVGAAETVGVPSGTVGSYVLRRVVLVPSDGLPSPSPSAPVDPSLWERVRFRFGERDDFPFGAKLWAGFLAQLASSSDEYRIPAGAAGDGASVDGWLESNGRRFVQLTTHQVDLDLRSSKDGRDLRVEGGRLRVFFSLAALPRWDEVLERLDELRTTSRPNGSETSPVIEKIRTLRTGLADRLAERIREEFALRVGVAIRFVWNDPQLGRQERVVSAGVRNVWPIETEALLDADAPEHARANYPAAHSDDTRYLVAPAYELEFRDAEWMPIQGANCTIELRLLETSKAAQLVEKLREYLADWSEKASRK